MTENLTSLFNELKVDCEVDYPLKGKCTYGTGGKADYICFPNTEKQFKDTVNVLKDGGIEYKVLGAGSNVLISDEGFRGVIISTEKLKGISVNGKLLTAYAGERLVDVITYALYSSLGGLEFLSGIPASIGGAVTMNAGCFNKNVSDYIAYVVSSSGVYNNNDCGFDYRSSRFLSNNDGVISVTFNLENVEYEQSESKIEYFKSLRRTKQPKGKSCGSVFKNDGYYAGKIIESCNLKGYKIGGASVSERHANFILADNTATSKDIKNLITYIKQKVKNDVGISLQEELIYIGKFDDENKF